MGTVNKCQTERAVDGRRGSGKRERKKERAWEVEGLNCHVEDSSMSK